MGQYAYKDVIYMRDYSTVRDALEQELGRELDDDPNYDGDAWLVVNQMLANRDAEIDRLRAEYDDALQTITDMQSKFEAVSAENEVLKKCCTQRGARMQIMRDWMDSKRGIGPPAEWWYFLEERPDAAKWFDADGVPIRSEGE
jgi:hypothetical protein